MKWYFPGFLGGDVHIFDGVVCYAMPRFILSRRCSVYLACRFRFKRRCRPWFLFVNGINLVSVFSVFGICSVHLFMWIHGMQNVLNRRVKLVLYISETRVTSKCCGGCDKDGQVLTYVQRFHPFCCFCWWSTSMHNIQLVIWYVLHKYQREYMYYRGLMTNNDASWRVSGVFQRYLAFFQVFTFTAGRFTSTYTQHVHVRVMPSYSAINAVY